MKQSNVFVLLYRRVKHYFYAITRTKLALFLIGFLSLVWFVCRVVPKPSRAGYPCMRAAAPAASAFVLYLTGFFVSILSWKKVLKYLRRSKYRMASLFLLAAFAGGIIIHLNPDKDALAEKAKTLSDPYPANIPVGTAKGIFPGRVVWAYDPDATNENCSPGTWEDAYFMARNNSQSTIDAMLASSLRSLTGAGDDSSAWQQLFTYYNQQHGKGETGYTAGEIIFIKVNGVHGSNKNMNKSDCSIKFTDQYGYIDTSPQVILAVLRQLINNAGIPQEKIYVGDPLCNIFKHSFDMWSTEFPNVHYLDHNGYTGREKAVPSYTPSIFYSDHGTILDESQDCLYTIFEDMDYMINIPALKGHVLGGVTFFCKNHFGSHTRSSAAHLHGGLMRKSRKDPLRTGYGLYRVFVDIMGHKFLGGKTLLYVMDGLWGTLEAHQLPVRWQMPPFNNDWSSSIFVSQDPVAIASVCYDFIKAEFKDLEHIQWAGVDDYLHQAADSSCWPDNIQYDPENDGTIISSLGVHEHWNNSNEKQYSRNIGSGNGIELVNVTGTSVRVDKQDHDIQVAGTFQLYQNYPNPFNPVTCIAFELSIPEHVSITVLNVDGQKVRTLIDGQQHSGSHIISWDGRNEAGQALASGTYFYRIRAGAFVRTCKMILMR